MNVYLNKVTDIYGTGMPLKSRGPFICFGSNNSKSIIPLKKFDDEESSDEEIYENYIRFYDTHELNDINVNGYVDVDGYLIADGTVIAGKYINISGYLRFANMIKCTDLNVNFLASSTSPLATDVDVNVSGNVNVSGHGNSGYEANNSIVLYSINKGNIVIDGNLTTNSALYTSNCDLTVSGDVNIGSDISITTMDGNIVIGRNLTTSGELSMINGDLTVSGDVNIGARISNYASISYNNIVIGGNLTTSSVLNTASCDLTVSGYANIDDVIDSDSNITIYGDLHLNSKSSLSGYTNTIKNLGCRNLYSTSQYLPFIDTNITCTDITCTNIENTNHRCSLSLNNTSINCSNIIVSCGSVSVDNIYYPNIIFNGNTTIDLRPRGNYNSSITCENIYVENVENVENDKKIYLYDSNDSKIYATYIRSTNSDSKELNIYMNNPDCFTIAADHIHYGTTLIKYYYDSTPHDIIHGTMV